MKNRRLQTASLLGALGSLAFVWLGLEQIDLRGIGKALGEARPWPWIPMAVALYLAGHVVRGLRCRRLVRQEANLPLATATNIVVLGYAVNNLLPARLGEIARAGLLAERTGIPFAQGLTVTLLERILDGMTILLLFLATWGITGQSGQWIAHTALVAALIIGPVAVCIGLMLRFPYSLAGLGSRLAAAVRPAWQGPVWRFFVYVSNGLAYFRRPADALALALLSLAVWAVDASMYLALLAAFGMRFSPEWAVFVMAVTNLGVLLPSRPGHVGTFHYFCLRTLMLLGADGAAATIYALVAHAVIFIPITFWGAGIVARYGVELGAVLGAARSAKKGPVVTAVDGIQMYVTGRSKPVGEDRPAGKLIRAITEALIPAPAARQPDERERGEVEKVARFVQGQVDALPAALRLLLASGLTGFRLLVRFRYLRSFCSLPLARRRRIVASWAYGRWALTRKLFRVLRSTALLGYYEYTGPEDDLAPTGSWQALQAGRGRERVGS
jgi:uncharacterized protein (TIRG00374 family)